MKKRLVSASAIGILLLVGCGAVPGDPAPAPPQPVEPVASTEPVAADVEHRWVQDLWVYESLARIDDDGGVIELTEDILRHLENSDGEAHTLPGEATFTVYSSLDPKVIGPDAQVRRDVDAVAGVLSTPDASGLAVLATPAPDAQAPVGLDDLIELDLTFLTALAPGDGLMADIAFLQAFAEPAPAGLSPVALLAHRLENKQTQHYGSDEHVGVFEMQLGQAVAGSTRSRMPAKADPMFEGFDEGIAKCRGGTKCVSDYHESFGAGVADSWALIDCNLTSTCGDPQNSNQSKQEPVQCVVGVKGGGCAEVRGDPHITTVDGRSLSMQAVGEFVGLRGEGLEVQLRTGAWKDSRTVSMLTAAVVKSASETVMVDLEAGQLRMHVGENQTALEMGSTLELTDLTIQVFPYVVQISTPNGEVVSVRHAGATHLGLTVSVDEDDDFVGLLVGAGLAEDFDHDEFYGDFVNSWRVTDADSAFRYGSGLSTADHTDLSFPDESVTMESLSAADRERAKAVCEASGVTSPKILAECIFDYVVTGSMEFVRAAKVAEMAHHESQTPARPTPAASTRIHGWHETASSYGVGTIIQVTCPAQEAPYSIPTVWGGNGGIYTADSSICGAAVHHGGISVDRGGVVTVERTEGQETYGRGTLKNGVKTSDWESPWSGSFVIHDARR